MTLSFKVKIPVSPRFHHNKTSAVVSDDLTEITVCPEDKNNLPRFGGCELLLPQPICHVIKVTSEKVLYCSSYTRRFLSLRV